MCRFHRFMSTPLAVILLGVVFVGLTLLTLGWEASWKSLVVLGAAGLADLVIGWGERRTLSEDVNRVWHKNPIRYAVWMLGVAGALYLMHLHFTGV